MDIWPYISMKNYSDSDDLLGDPYKLVASWWDSLVFVDRENPDAILKLYDPLTREEILQYYELQSRLAQIWVMEDQWIEVEILDPSDKLQVIDHEDGVLVVLPRVDGIGLPKYITDINGTILLSRVKQIMENHGLPTTWWFEVKPENLTVVPSWDSKKIRVVITDLWARIEECLRGRDTINIL